MAKEKTKEPQYQRCVTLRDKHGYASLGLGVNQLWHDDPKHLVFLLSRYKFVAKMLSGKNRVLEIGCGDAFGSRVVKQEVKKLTVVDFDPLFIESARKNSSRSWPLETKVHDILKRPVAGTFDAVFSLDVIEHIPKRQEKAFLKNAAASLQKDGVLIIGTPSLQSQAHASKLSKAGHVNCKDHKALKILLSKYFRQVFIFSMNDEVVHTGFYPMAHYLFALCCSKK